MRRRIDRLRATFAAWLFAPGDPRRLAALRIGLAGLLALRLATGPYLDLAHQPAALFRPISFLKLLPQMPPPGVVVPLQVIAVAAALLATVGLWTRVALPVAYLAALPLIAMTCWIPAGRACKRAKQCRPWEAGGGGALQPNNGRGGRGATAGRCGPRWW